MLERTPAAISPTAHYTGEVWRRNGLSHPALATRQGRVLHTALRPLTAMGRLTRAADLDEYLLARHELIDRLLEEAIDAGAITQVVEIAAGLSPRGLRMSERHPGLTYIEADLPAMAARKREALERAGAGHQVVELDALADSGGLSLAGLAGGLDRRRGLAIITEGLLNYFPRTEVEGMWTRFASVLGGFPSGLYLADIVVRTGTSDPIARLFSYGLGIFVRGQIHIHFDDPEEVAEALEAAGFARADVHSGREVSETRGARRTNVIAARPAR